MQYKCPQTSASSNAINSQQLYYQLLLWKISKQPTKNRIRDTQPNIFYSYSIFICLINLYGFAWLFRICLCAILVRMSAWAACYKYNLCEPQERQAVSDWAFVLWELTKSIIILYIGVFLLTTGLDIKSVDQKFQAWH